MDDIFFYDDNSITKKASIQQVEFYPNPVTDLLNVTYNSVTNTPVVIKIYYVTGIQVEQKVFAILMATFLLLIAGAFSSNTILKKQYDELDKSDIYWNYDKILQQPFSHLKITGGNETNIIYEQSKKPSVRLLHEWVYYHGGI